MKSLSAGGEAVVAPNSNRPRFPEDGGVGTKSDSTNGFPTDSVFGFFFTRIRFLDLLAAAAEEAFSRLLLLPASASSSLAGKLAKLGDSGEFGCKPATRSSGLKSVERVC
jgi:hypothetical protein